MMFKLLLTGSSILGLLLASSLPASAEAPPDSQLSSPTLQQPSQPLAVPAPTSTTLPELSDGNLREYAATDAVPVLQVGSHGVVVEDVQKFLQRSGLYTGAIDGIYGRQSKAAIAQFQTQANLVPDGIVGFDTWRALLNSQPS